MVKSAVRAMDCVQELLGSNEGGSFKIDNFVVAGGSKRGWTTWLTAAADPRVKAIAPMVIDTLNMREQGPYQLKSFGAYSEQVSDYTARGLLPMPDTPAAKRLWAMVDPYSYRDRLTLPKLLINGNNDEYWTSDALNLYWDGLKGDKWVLYVPNAGHKLEQQGADGRPDRTRAVNALAAFGRHYIVDNPMPKLTWKHDDAAGKARLTVRATPAPKAARLWVAQAPTRDFRKAKWGARPVSLEEGRVVGLVAPPETGFVAFYAELDYAVGGLPYQLSTQLRVLGK
jgi:PhoPQ-activated pathogenicity-related protein